MFNCETGYLPIPLFVLFLISTVLAVLCLYTFLSRRVEAIKTAHFKQRNSLINQVNDRQSKLRKSDQALWIAKSKLDSLERIFRDGLKDMDEEERTKVLAFFKNDDMFFDTGSG